MQEYVENVLAPRLRGDGGWVEFVQRWRHDPCLPW